MQLEEDLGAALFQRNNHRIVLTEDGILLKRRAQELLELAEKTQREFQSREELTGEIAIGCGETCNMASLSDWMASFREQHPLIQFRIRTAIADDVKEQIEKGILDMGLLLEPVETPHYDSVRMPQKERWGALVRTDSPLAGMESLSPEELLRWPLLLPWRESVLSQVMGWFGENRAKMQEAGRGRKLYASRTGRGQHQRPANADAGRKTAGDAGRDTLPGKAAGQAGLSAV